MQNYATISLFKMRILKLDWEVISMQFYLFLYKNAPQPALETLTLY